jgi:chromosome segregation protein
MFLRSLTLKGFKSFADATTLELEPGVTVVVGPNGSGKSNVVDAIAWVLGAQAPSAVRSQKMDDVIFAGTDRRSALGRAEVMLTIDNSAGLLPIEFTEVTLSRTLFRTGESEYAINGVNCRLLDLQELLSDTGVGRQQHVIVSQGQIDGVLNARPEERRAIIEEAAGVLKYRKRKEKAERRLEATEANLVRLQDLLREVRRQLRPLERQAEAARRHGELVGELDALRLFLAGREISALQARLATLAGEQAATAEAERSLRAALARLDTDVMAAEAQLTAVGGTDLADALGRVDQLRERARGLGAVVAERRRATERDVGRLLDTSMVATLEADATRLRAELDQVAAALADVEPVAEALEADEAELAAAEAALGAALPLVDALAGRGAAEVRGELRTLRLAIERAAVEDATVSRRLAELDGRAAEMAGESERLRTELEAAQGDEAPLVAELARAEARHRAADEAVAAAEQAHTAAVSARDTWVTRAGALALALDQARARAGLEQLADVEEVIGALLDLVEVDDGWAAAFEAAAGEALAAVVVRDVRSARRVLTLLHEQGAAGAVLALGAPSAIRSPVPAMGEPVRRHVRGRGAGIDELLDVLLGTAVAVDGGWQEALDVVVAHPGAVVVTRVGDRFGPLGWRLGTAGTGATGAALDEARARAGTADAEVAVRLDGLAAARVARRAATDAEADILRRLDAVDARFHLATERLSRVQTERRDAATEAATLRATHAVTAERHARERTRVAELEANLPGLEAEESAEAEQARARRQAAAELQERAGLIGHRRRDLAVRRAGLVERDNFLGQRLAEVEDRLRADVDARADAEQRRTRLEATLATLDRLHAIVEGHRVTLDAEHADLAARRQRQSEVARAAARTLEALRHERAEAERGLEEARERARRTEIDQAEARLRLESAVENLRRDHDVEPAAATAAECPPLPDGATPAGRARELERELRILGPINPLALEEFTALQERHQFLEAQLEDVKTTRRELGRVIRAIDAEIESVFAAAYADVREHFAALFATLFPGGRGELVLTQPDDLLNTGIEVEAKPSGKNVKKLSLLSGGERSLTALAFLFAVFRGRPSPFYVMDEVEAALDDVNLHRFLSLVEEFRQEAQLIIVSHQKRTMEAADSLYGVTMQPGGSSKVLSEQISADA